jgi:hypothetical protein
MNEVKLNVNQLIELVLLLSNTKKNVAAKKIGITKATFSSFMWKKKGTRLERIKAIFKVCEIPFNVAFENKVIEDFNYYEFSISNPAKFEKYNYIQQNIFNICRHFEALGEQMNVVILGTKYIIKH